MPTKQAVHTDRAPAPRAGAPYSQGVVAGDFVFVSGQLPLDPRGGSLVSDEIGPQTEQALANLAAVLDAAGSSLDQVVKTTVFLADLDDWEAMNDVYRRVVGTTPPARSAVQCGRLPPGVRIEIEAIALRA